MEATVATSGASAPPQEAPEAVSTVPESVAVELLPLAPSNGLESQQNKAPHESNVDVARADKPISVKATVHNTRLQRDDGDLHALLATAALRQKTFQDIRDASLEIGARDDRKCDYAMTPVPRVPSAQRRPSARRGSRQFQPPSVDGSIAANEKASDFIPTEAGSEDANTGAFGWRQHLETHVAHVLIELRRRPDQLRMLLTAHYSNNSKDPDESSSDDEAADSNRLECGKHQGPQNSLNGAPSEVLALRECSMQSVSDLYAKLSDIGVRLGEAIYHQIRKMLVKSVKRGVIDRSSNLVRLESMFKLELRRQVTLERLQQAVLSKLDDSQTQKPRVQARRDTAKGDRVVPAQAQDTLTRAETEWREPEAADTTTVTSAHHFKMQALERILVNNRKSLRQELSSTNIARIDQLGGQIQDRVTAAIYSKNRENYPFWKDPPESALTRDETAKLLRVVISSFGSVSLFFSLSVDQLIEIAKHTRWKVFGQGCFICTKDTPVDYLFVVMEGVAACILEADVSASYAQEPSRIDERRSTDSSMGLTRTGYGEMGLLSKSELWPSTVSVCSSQAKALILTRDSFDIALAKIFGGPKRQITRDSCSGKRPTSSPGVTRTQVQSTPRPLSSSAREQAILRFQQYRNECEKRSVEEPQEHASVDAPVEISHAPTSDTSRSISPRPTLSKRPRQPSGVYQHYPTFPFADGGSAGSHMFRLKSIQPIAFAMKSVEDLVEDEWAPAFPDTSTLIDYMNAVESSFLFEKRNVLIKDNLRAVCTNLPFQDDPTLRNRADDCLSYYQDPTSESAALEDAIAQQTMNSSDPNDARAVVRSGGSSVYAIGSPVDGDPMTLGQFADARRRISSRVGALSNGYVSQSMRNMLASAATSATLAKNGNAPFVSSFFVPESSFQDDMRNLIGSHTDNEEDVPAADQHHADLDLPEVDDNSGDESKISGHTASAGDIDTSSSPTKARMMALDSIINTLGDRTPTKRKVIDQEAARRVILQKHLNAANEGTSLTKLQDSRKGSLLNDGKGILANGAASNAPLPLRADLQRRMEAVLASLKMKPKAKLDLVLKYTHADYYDQFPDAVVLWEQASHYILKREKALEALREFELVASDPRRHFRSLSTHRLVEQKERDALFYQLNYPSDLCRESLDELEKRCGDVVFVENRLYREKMKKDYTELLFEVEQERLRMIYKDVHPVVTDNRSSTRVDTSRVTSRCNQQEDTSSPMEERGLSPPQVIAGSRSTPTEPRYTLSTPRESIYLSVIDRIAQEEREEREQTRQVPEDSKGKAAHKLSAQVRQHRQAQLDGITSHTRALPPKADVSQVREASATTPMTPPTTAISSLKHALEKALGR